MQELMLTIPPGHPSLRGHFPGSPVLPGVVLLDELLCAIERTAQPGRWRIATAKFVRPVRPGETLTLGHERLANGSIRFNVLRGQDQVAHGVLVPDEAEQGSSHA